MDKVSQHPIEYQSRREALSRNAGAHPFECVSSRLHLNYETTTLTEYEGCGQ
jgi:hypothetical protein